MLVELLKGKLHQARITACELYYEGSLAIDLDLVEAAGMRVYEKILVVNANNGERLVTYVIPAERGSRTFCLNGAAARRGVVGDVLTIMSFAQMTPEEAEGHKPTIVILNEKNAIVARKSG